MRYFIIENGDDGLYDTYMTEDLTDKVIDMLFYRKVILLDSKLGLECYRLDNDHQPVWEDIEKLKTTVKYS